MPLHAADFFVTTDSDVNSGACTTSACSLRDAILASNSIAGPSTIHLAALNYGVMIQGSGENDGLTGDFDVKGDLTIIGAGRDATKLFISSPSEQIIDVAAGARLRLEHLSIGIGIRSGSFGRGSVAATWVELSDVKAGQGNASGHTIVANGNLLIENSTVESGWFSPGQTAIIFSGRTFDISNSMVDWQSAGVRAALAPDGSARIANSFFTRDSGTASDPCGSFLIEGGQRILITGSQIKNRAALGVGTCIRNAQDVAIIDSAITVDATYNKAASIDASTTTVRNSTIVGSLSVGGTVLLDQVTVGSNVSVVGDIPVSVSRAAGSVVTVSNSALIGKCSGTVVALGNNVESPGNTCGLPAATSRVDRTYASLELGTLASHTPLDTPDVPVNYLPSPMSVLNRVFTRLGILRCQVTDQRGFVRAPICTIGAVETDASEQVLFRNGFDN